MSTPQTEAIDEILHTLYNSGWVEGEDYATKTFDGREVSTDVITEREKRKIANAREALSDLLIEARIEELSYIEMDEDKPYSGMDGLDIPERINKLQATLNKNKEEI